MADHYFSSNPNVESDPKTWSFSLRGHTLRFTSDRGVFSKNEVDFGSRQLIEMFEMPEIPGPILDVGCGYGPIGLSLAKAFPERKVIMVDVNQRAIDLAKKNAADNSITNVDIFSSDLLEKVETNDFAAILTNPPIRVGKETVHKLFEDAYNHLAVNGELWIVIQKKQGAPSAIEKLKTMSQEVTVVGKKKGYYIIKVKKC